MSVSESLLPIDLVKTLFVLSEVITALPLTAFFENGYVSPLFPTYFVSYYSNFSNFGAPPGFLGSSVAYLSSASWMKSSFASTALASVGCFLTMVWWSMSLPGVTSA
jgi:hypothetical protein